jgi:hypothetical protein
MTNEKCLSCHIIGLNPYAKKEIITNINIKIFNFIDLDEINQEVLRHPTLDKLYRQYQKLKDDKNDKFKEVDKKMSDFWANNFIELIENKINKKKMNVLIGQNNHYKSLTKRVPIECTNKFIVKVNIDDEVKSWVKYNLETYGNEIIEGTFPLEYINHDYLYKKRVSIENTYKKIGYIEKSIDQIKTIFNLIENKNENKNLELWVSLKEPYNIGSLIHPKVSDKISAFKDANVAILSSINFDSNQVKRKFNGSEITLKEINPQGMNKLKTRRFLYLVDPDTFIPHEKGNNQKFFSQLPVKILAKEKIDNVYNYLIE